LTGVWYGEKKYDETWSKKFYILDYSNSSVIVWGCMSVAGVGNLHIIDGIMYHKIYIDIFKKNFHVITQKLGSVDNYFLTRQ